MSECGCDTSFKCFNHRFECFNHRFEGRKGYSDDVGIMALNDPIESNDRIADLEIMVNNMFDKISSLESRINWLENKDLGNEWLENKELGNE